MVLEMKYEVKKMVFESFDTMVEVAFRIEDVLREKDILRKMETTTTMVRITTIIMIKEITHIGIRKNKWSMMELWIPQILKTKLFFIWLVLINKVKRQDIKKDLKERNTTLHNWVSHMKGYS